MSFLIIATCVMLILLIVHYFIPSLGKYNLNIVDSILLDMYNYLDSSALFMRKCVY